MVAADEHPRPDTTIEMLAKLKPIVQPGRHGHRRQRVGHQRRCSCALLLASEDAVRTHGLTPRARFVAVGGRGRRAARDGHRPGAGDRRRCSRARASTIDQMDVIELNEAFAAQALAVLRAPRRARRRAARQPERRRDRDRPSARRERRASGHHGDRTSSAAPRGRYALCTMCVGVGQGIALLIERV